MFGVVVITLGLFGLVGYLAQLYVNRKGNK